MARKVEVDVVANDKSNSGISSFERNLKRVSKAAKASGEDSGKNFGQGILRTIGLVSPKLAKTLGNALGGGVPEAVKVGVIAGVTAAAAVAAPVLGSAVAGAVIGGAAGVGIIGGVLLAAQNPKVQAAGKTLSGYLFGDIATRAASFIGPVLKVIELVRANYHDIADEIQGIFQNTSRYLEPLTRGVLGAVRAIIGGISAAVMKAGPVISAISHGINQVGTAIGDMLREISSSPARIAAAATALRLVFSVVEGAIRIATTALNVFLDTFGLAAKVGAFGKDVQAQFIAYEIGAAKATDATKNTTIAFNNAKFASSSLAMALQLAAAASDAMSEANRTLYGATTSVGEAILRTKEALKQNGRTLSENTAKGLENRRALEGLATASLAQYNAVLKANGAGEKANAVAARNYNAFVKAAQGFGMSRSAAIALANSLGLIPPKKETKSKFDKTQAEKTAVAYKRQLDGIPRSIVTTVRVNRVGGDGNNQNSPSIGGGGGRTFDATKSFAMSPGSTNSPRTGGPAKVSVDSNVTVLLDGRPFREYTTESIKASEDKQRYKARYGGRYS